MAWTIPGLFSDLLDSFEEGRRRLKVAINEELIGGNQAITTQSFTELNSKQGSQYEAGFYASLANGESAAIVIEVGSTADVLVKDIGLQFNGTDIDSVLYKNPIYTGGSGVDVFNFNDRDAIEGDVQIKAGVSVTSSGIQVSPLTVSLGSEGQGNRALSSIAMTAGVERVLSKSSNYLYLITNNSGATQEISGLATWYQGPLSTQE